MNESTGIHLDDIGQIAITVSDLAQAKQFYGEILGMKFLFDAGSMAFFQCASIRLLIGTGEPGATAGTGTILYFRVSDLPAVHRNLRSKDVQFRQEPHLVAHMKTHDLWIAFLSDPSGNLLGLMSEVPRA